MAVLEVFGQHGCRGVSHVLVDAGAVEVNYSDRAAQIIEDVALESLRQGRVEAKAQAIALLGKMGREPSARLQNAQGASATDPRKRSERLRQKWGMTLAEFDNMVSAHDDTCPVCLSKFGTTAGKRAVIDHDHSTGKVRGLLCSGCNAALGKIGDSIESLSRLQTYLLAEKTAPKWWHSRSVK